MTSKRTFQTTADSISLHNLYLLRLLWRVCTYVTIVCRQAALSAHLPLVHKLQRKDAFDINSNEDEDDIQEWYPAGVSQWHYEDGVLEMAEGWPYWMDDVSISAMELHGAAVIIQR